MLHSCRQKTWISGIILSLALLVANYLVFQNLMQTPAPSPIQDYNGKEVFSPIAAAPVSPLNLSTLEEFKKREHIRTLVFRNFKGFPYKERAVLFEVIYNQSRQMGIDPYITLSMIATESSFQRRAVSWAGAYGLMQIKPIAAEEIAPDAGITLEGEETLFDPAVNITLGIRYLAKMKKRFGNISDALTAYNYGPQYVVSCLRNDKRLPDKYVKKIERNLLRYGLNTSAIGLDNRV